MSTRTRLGIAAVVALVSAAGVGIVVAGWVGGHGNPRLPIGLHATPGVAPFAGYREVRVAIGRRCARVVVAETDAQRSQGLRGASALGPYAGMLFAMGGDSNVAFTMSGVASPLDITWYSAGGGRVDKTHMRPCPRVQHCPVYRSRERYRYALEVPTRSPDAPARLAPCSS